MDGLPTFQPLFKNLLPLLAWLSKILIAHQCTIHVELASWCVARANASFNSVPGLSTTGFTLTLVYTNGDLARQTACNLLQSAVQCLNPRYHARVVGVDWHPYLSQAVFQKLPMFCIGISASFFPDPHDFTSTFYDSTGAFPSWQSYNNATMDTLIRKGIGTQDGPEKQSGYTARARSKDNSSLTSLALILHTLPEL
jgi:hypothetical protein